MRSDDRSWPIRLADLNKCYDSCNYNIVNNIYFNNCFASKIKQQNWKEKIGDERHSNNLKTIKVCTAGTPAVLITFIVNMNRMESTR